MRHFQIVWDKVYYFRIEILLNNLEIVGIYSYRKCKLLHKPFN